MVESFRVCESEGWELRLWTDEDARALRMVNRSHFDESESLGLRSDLMRYEVSLAALTPASDCDADLAPAGRGLRRRRLRVSPATLFLPPPLRLQRPGAVHLPLRSVPHLSRSGRGEQRLHGVSRTRLNAWEVTSGRCTPGHPLVQRVLHAAGDNLSRRRLLHSALTAGTEAFLSPDSAAFLAALSPPGLPSPAEVIHLSGPLCLSACLSDALAAGGPEVNGLAVFPAEVLHPVPNNISVDLADDFAVAELKREYLTEASLAVHW